MLDRICSSCVNRAVPPRGRSAEDATWSQELALWPLELITRNLISVQETKLHSKSLYRRCLFIYPLLIPPFFLLLLFPGSAFPTTVSVNHIICNFSPLPTEASSSQALKKGDVVKIQLGAQLDGFAAVAAETLVVGATKEEPVEGKVADLLKAVQVASEVALRVMKPGAISTEVAKKIEEAVKEFGQYWAVGMRSWQGEFEGKEVE